MSIDPDTVLMIGRLIPLVFVFAFGACVGSLINVLVYRMPRGLDVVRPSSRCPSCETVLTWRENIPIVGWLLLRGRCRFCRSRISARYPIVETFVAVLFTGLCAAWYLLDRDATLLGVPVGLVRPAWAEAGPGATWPTMVVILTLMACLVAMTLIDAETFTIPLELTWVPAAVALVVHPLHAWWVQAQFGRLPSLGISHAWVIATPDWWWLGAAAGATLGLGVSLLMVRLGLIGRSFADYDAWEQSQLEAQAAEAAQAGAGTGTEPGTEPGAAAGGPGGVGEGGDPTPLWTAYPHARREMVRELAFLCVPVVMGLAGGAVTMRLLPPLPEVPEGTLAVFGHAPPPGWLAALGGVLLGYLIGGGVVWLVRIGGSLGFGKEAMGMGDVHLMAAVGACLGWIDAVAAFFAAAFVGVAYAGVGLVSGGRLRRTMPYGPFLAVATLLVLVGKPALEWGLNALMPAPPGVPPIDLP